MTFFKSSITTPISIERTLRISKCVSYSLFSPLLLFSPTKPRISQRFSSKRNHASSPFSNTTCPRILFALYLIRGIPFWACTVCIFNRNTSSVGRFLYDDDFFLFLHFRLAKENSHILMLSCTVQVRFWYMSYMLG